MNKNSFIEKFLKFLKSILLEVAIIGGGLFLDLLSKGLIAENMNLGDSLTIIPKFLNFTYVLNDKAAFGSAFGLENVLGDSGVMIFFVIFTLLAVGFFGFLLFKKPKKHILYRISFALIISGALGNLYDRITFGYVRDFIQIEYFGLELFGYKTFAIFNFADSCVVVGAILLIVFLVFIDDTFKEKKPVEQANVTEEDAPILNEANEIVSDNNDANLDCAQEDTKKES